MIPVNDQEFLPVSEMFYSIQGEGRTMGIPSLFFRLGACNLVCGGQKAVSDMQPHDGAKWVCDSIPSWTKPVKKTFADIFTEWEEKDWIKYLRVGAHLILTGGEPTIHQDKLFLFLELFRTKYGFCPAVEIETNGTRLIKESMLPKLHYINCSPKLSNSGMPERRRLIPNVIQQLNLRASTIFKFVIFDRSDFNEALRTYIVPFNIDNRKVYLMPAGSSQVQLKKTELEVAELAKEYAFNFSSRLHVLLWDKALGV